MLETTELKLKRILLILISIVFLGTSGCMSAYKRSVGATTQQNFSRVFSTDFNLAWQSTLDALKSVRLDVTNREAGFIQTRWIDNTAEKNFKDGSGGTSVYMKAQYRFKVSVAKSVYQGKEAIKVTVQREQLASRDALDDFRPLESDTIEENTLLYRIGRLIQVRTRLAKLEESETQAAVKRATEGGIDGGENVPPPPSEETSGERVEVPEEVPQSN